MDVGSSLSDKRPPTTRRDYRTNVRPKVFGGASSAFTLSEVLVVVAILGLLAGIYIFKTAAALRPIATTVSAGSLQGQIEQTYAAWVVAGGTHGATATTLVDQSNMAFDILQVLNSLPGINAVPTNSGTTGVTESSLNGPQPLSNTVRLQSRSRLLNTVNGVIFNMQYYILFKPTGVNSGIWAVSAAGPYSAPL